MDMKQESRHRRLQKGAGSGIKRVVELLAEGYKKSERPMLLTIHYKINAVSYCKTRKIYVTCELAIMCVCVCLFV